MLLFSFLYLMYDLDLFQICEIETIKSNLRTMKNDLKRHLTHPTNKRKFYKDMKDKKCEGNSDMLTLFYGL